MVRPRVAAEKIPVKNATRNNTNEEKSFVKGAKGKDLTKATVTAQAVTLFCSEKECYPTADSVS